jgi:type 1 glutamine amidotransferase
MRSIILALLASTSFLTSLQADEKPIKALLLIGGCCHEYEKQLEVLKTGLGERLKLDLTVEFNPKDSRDIRFETVTKPEWSKPYDVVIYDICTGDVKDNDYIQKILDGHREKPAVALHCSMHSFRHASDDRWSKFLGIRSMQHGPKKPITVNYTKPHHPITQGFEDWTIEPSDELYNNVKVYPGTIPLATGSQWVKGKEAEPATATVVWVTEASGVRVFGTTLGHGTSTVADPRYLDLVTRGILWATKRLPVAE